MTPISNSNSNSVLNYLSSCLLAISALIADKYFKFLMAIREHLIPFSSKPSPSSGSSISGKNTPAAQSKNLIVSHLSPFRYQRALQQSRNLTSLHFSILHHLV